MRTQTYTPQEILETIPVHHHKVGKRIQLKLQYVSCTKSFGCQRYTKYHGNPYIYKLKFRDEMGRLYIWETSRTTEYNFEKGEWLLLVGRVEGFTSIEGEYHTMMKNCKYAKF